MYNQYGGQMGQQQMYQQQQMHNNQQQQMYPQPNTGYSQPQMNQGYMSNSSHATPGVMPGSNGIERWQPTPAQIAYYDTLFGQADAVGTGKIAGKLAVKYFTKSQLPKEILRQVCRTLSLTPTHCKCQKLRLYFRFGMLLTNENSTSSRRQSFMW
jgi:hypothetical protein